MKRILLMFCMLSMPALGDPVTWYIEAIMNDKATISGSFIFDDDTDLFSNVFLNYDGILGDRTFTFPLSVGANFIYTLRANVANLTKVPILYLFISTLLTNAGGSFNFEDTSLDLNLLSCTDIDCASTSLLTGIASGVIYSIDTVGVPVFADF